MIIVLAPFLFGSALHRPTCSDFLPGDIRPGTAVVQYEASSLVWVQHNVEIYNSSGDIVERYRRALFGATLIEAYWPNDTWGRIGYIPYSPCPQNRYRIEPDLAGVNEIEINDEFLRALTGTANGTKWINEYEAIWEAIFAPERPFVSTDGFRLGTILSRNWISRSTICFIESGSSERDAVRRRVLFALTNHIHVGLGEQDNVMTTITA